MQPAPTIAALLLLANLVLLVGIGVRGSALEQDAVAAPTPRPARERLGEDAEIRLSGMPGYQGEACADLERFVRRLNRDLAAAGVRERPVGDAQLAHLRRGTCSLEDPAVRRALEPYRRLFGAAGLRPLPPFSYLGE